MSSNRRMFQELGLFSLFSFPLQTGNLSGDAFCAAEVARCSGTEKERKEMGVQLEKTGGSLRLGFLLSDSLLFTAGLKDSRERSGQWQWGPRPLWAP